MIDALRILYARAALIAWRLTHALLASVVVAFSPACALPSLFTSPAMQERAQAVAAEAGASIERILLIVFGAATAGGAGGYVAGRSSRSGGRRWYDPVERPERHDDRRAG